MILRNSTEMDASCVALFCASVTASDVSLAEVATLVMFTAISVLPAAASLRVRHR